MANEMLLFTAGSLGRLVRRIVDRNLKSIGLTSAQIRVLLFIAKRDSAHQKEIEDGLLLTRATVSAMVDTLESMGLIVRKKDSDDARAWRIVITERGLEKIEEAKVSTEVVENTMLSVLSENERDMYMDITKKLRNALEENL